jgi:hypothetical protein
MSAFEQSRHLKTPQAPPNHRQHMGCESTFNGGTISTKNAAKSKSQLIFGGPESCTTNKQNQWLKLPNFSNGA